MALAEPLVEPPDLALALFADGRRYPLKSNDNPDFFFKWKPGERPAAFGFRPEYGPGCPVVHVP
jgi:hypothetical protein